MGGVVVGGAGRGEGVVDVVGVAVVIVFQRN